MFQRVSDQFGSASFVTILRPVQIRPFQIVEDEVESIFFMNSGVFVYEDPDYFIQLIGLVFHYFQDVRVNAMDEHLVKLPIFTSLPEYQCGFTHLQCFGDLMSGAEV